MSFVAWGVAAGMWVGALAVEGVASASGSPRLQPEAAVLGGPLEPPEVGPGGEVAEPCAWPAAVGLYSRGLICSGTLIHPEIVAFAAHCPGGEQPIQFGEKVIAPALEVQGACRSHPKFAGRVGEWDYAYCRLDRAVTVPFVPPAMGCERGVQAGTAVVAAGFGVQMPGGKNGVKRWARTAVLELGELSFTAGSADAAGCLGDSGGGAYVRLGDGSWRTLGVLSSSPTGRCGGYARYSWLDLGIPWIEEDSGVDVTPCHDADGTWNPGPACTGFVSDPEVGSGRPWSSSCAGTLAPAPTACVPPQVGMSTGGTTTGGSSGSGGGGDSTGGTGAGNTRGSSTGVAGTGTTGGSGSGGAPPRSTADTQAGGSTVAGTSGATGIDPVVTASTSVPSSTSQSRGENDEADGCACVVSGREGTLWPLALGLWFLMFRDGGRRPRREGKSGRTRRRTWAVAAVTVLGVPGSDASANEGPGGSSGSGEDRGTVDLHDDQVEDPSMAAGEPSSSRSTPLRQTTKKVLFVNFDGATLTGASIPTEDATQNRSALCQGAYPPFGAGPLRDAAIQATRERFAAYGITVVDTRPASGPYEMVMVGATRGLSGNCPSSYGRAVMDCGDQNPNNIPIVNHWNPGRVGANGVAATIGQEFGHAVGLDHVNGPGTIMNPSVSDSSTSWGSTCLPVTGSVFCGAQHRMYCPGGGQNADAELKAILGEARPDAGPPTVAIVVPTQGATYPVGAAFKITAEAADDVGVVSVELFVNEGSVGKVTQAPYRWSAEGIPVGTFGLVAEAKDAAGNTARSSVVTFTVTQGPTASTGNGPPGGGSASATGSSTAAASHGATGSGGVGTSTQVTSWGLTAAGTFPGSTAPGEQAPEGCACDGASTGSLASTAWIWWLLGLSRKNRHSPNPRAFVHSGRVQNPMAPDMGTPASAFGTHVTPSEQSSSVAPPMRQNEEPSDNAAHSG